MMIIESNRIIRPQYVIVSIAMHGEMLRFRLSNPNPNNPKDALVMEMLLLLAFGNPKRTKEVL
jgi:hypothetical protein